MLYMLGLAALLGTYNNVHMIGFADAKEMNNKRALEKCILRRKSSQFLPFPLPTPFLSPLSFGGAKERGSLGVIEKGMHPLFFIRILEELLQRAVKKLTKRIHTLKPYGLRLVIEHTAYTLVAHSHLLEQPVF